MRRALACLTALAACCGASVALAQDGERFFPTFMKDPKGDAKGGLDAVRVALGRGSDGRLRAEVTMAGSWDAESLGEGGTVCVRLYAKRDPQADPPDYLVCASPPADGDELRGSVLRDRVNGLPKRVAAATVTRPTQRTVYLRFAQSAIGRPASIRFSAETVVRSGSCAAPVGCRDTAPDAPRTVRLPLRDSR